MCPIEIESTAPYYLSSDPETLLNEGNIRTGGYTARGDAVVFVLPVGLPAAWVVKVKGFENAPGGMIESARFTSGFKNDEQTITTKNDPDLYQEIGVSEIKVDGIKYTAINPV